MRNRRSWVWIFVLVATLSVGSCFTTEPPTDGNGKLLGNGNINTNSTNVADTQSPDTSQEPIPLVVTIENVNDPAYKTNTAAYQAASGKIKSMMAGYAGQVRFITLNAATAKNPDEAVDNSPVKIDNQPQKQKIKDFFAENKAKPTAAAIFYEGSKKLNIAPLEAGRSGVVTENEVAKYTTEFRQKLEDILNSQTGNKALNQRLRNLDERIRELNGRVNEKSGDALPIVALILTLLALILIVWNMLSSRTTAADLKKEIAGLTWTHGNLGSELATIREKLPPPVNPSMGQIGANENPAQRKESEEEKAAKDALLALPPRFDKHVTAMAALQTTVDEINARLVKSEKQVKQAMQALNQTVYWLGDLELSGVETDGFSGSEAEREAKAGTLTDYRQQLRAHAERIEPVTRAMADQERRLRLSGSASPELLAQVQKFYQEIKYFDQSGEQVDKLLESLQQDSVSERRNRLRMDLESLQLQKDADQLSFSAYIQQYSRLIKQHFPVAQNGSEPITIDTEEIKQVVANVRDYLMDWYSGFTHFIGQAQATTASDSRITADTIEGLTIVLSVAREVLNRYGIMPEEIQVGQTTYDHRLHDVATVKPSAQYAANTVIEVERSGFRLMENGEVLRRPVVIISGTTG